MICKLISSFTAPLWFAPRVAMLFKRMKTTQYIFGKDMTISKTSGINLMKHLENVEKIWYVYSNFIFKSTYVDSQARKSLIWKFTTHRVVCLKLVNLLPFISHWDGLAICWITMRLLYNSLVRNSQWLEWDSQIIAQ